MIQQNTVWSSKTQYDPTKHSMIQQNTVWSNKTQYDPTKHSMIQLTPVEQVYFTNIHLYNCFFCKEILSLSQTLRLKFKLFSVTSCRKPSNYRLEFLHLSCWETLYFRPKPMQNLAFKIFSVSLEYGSIIFQTPRLAAGSIHRIFCISRVRKHLTLDPDPCRG
jgi:hypothetical protein